MTELGHGLAGPGATAEESEILDALFDSVSRFSADHIDSEKIDREHHIDRSILEGLAELGLFGLSIPEEHGGFGLSMQGVCSAVGHLAYYDRSVAVTVGLHLGLGTRGLVRYGSQALKEAYLPELAAGERIASFATTEAGADSDLAAIRVKAVEDGSELVVNGEKIFVTNGGFADLYTITASTPGLGGARKGHSMLLLERGEAGLEPGAEEDKLGMRGSSTITLHLDELRIPSSRVVGEAGQGMGQLQHVLAWGRTAMAGGCLGGSKLSLDKTVQHITTRKQFGQELGRFAVVREQVADMAAVVYAMEALVRYTTSVESDEALLVKRSTSAKVFVSDEMWWVTDLALQLHGGSGFIEETGIAMLLRDARIARIWEGANDVLTVHLGTMESLTKDRGTPLAEQVSESCSELAQRAELLRDRVHDWRAAAQKANGIRIMRRQWLLHRLGRLALLRDAVEATVLRADAEGTEAARLLATHFLQLAEARMAPALTELADRDVIGAITDHLYEGLLS